MNEVREQKTENQVGESESLVKKVYQPLETKVVEVKVEKGYATSESSPVQAPQWGNGSW